jgi:uncharacterized phage-associated protein
LSEEVCDLASADDVAAALLLQVGRVTTKKLQKLVYYSQAWHLVFTGQPLFGDDIQAWVEGPVVPSLYRQHKRMYQVSEWKSGDPTALSDAEVNTIDWVLAKYGEFSAETLSRMTHLEVPWIVARGLAGHDERASTVISHDQMRSFYSRQRTDPDVAVAQAAASAAMEGANLDDDWQSVLREVAAGTRSAAEVIEEEINRARKL